MQVNRIENHAQNFGMKCPLKLKAKIWESLPPDEFLSLFKNGDKLAESIDSIGSKHTSLEKFSIKRNVGENFIDGEREIWDTCSLVFKMLNAKGKKEKVTAQIQSALGGKPLSDIHQDFINVTLKAEKAFIDGYMNKQAQKGNLATTAGALKKLYPEYTSEIVQNEQNLSIKNQAAEEMKKTLLGKIRLFFR